MELAALFCEACGYGLKVLPINMDGLLASVQTGKSDFVASGISITPEREESMYFSESIYSGGTVLAVLKADGTELSGGRNPFLSRIASSFNKTFIRENRWKLFLEGIDNTLQITVLSILFGTILGFLVFMTCRNGNPVANGIIRFSTYLVQGMPMVVLLMILYYVIFGNVSISGIAVAVIGFTLTFGSSVCSMLRMGVSTIDRGQYEAAYALGHTNRHTFFRIILPQAIPIVLPAYQGEVTGLLKATSIVGYIAVQDLTKMGDIVRSRTYEAFFPLIAITIIYFLLEGIFSLALSFVRKAINPRKRSREQILKGVNVHD
jgi:polar amino acid transport system substrate-binding protein